MNAGRRRPIVVGVALLVLACSCSRSPASERADGRPAGSAGAPAPSSFQAAHRILGALNPMLRPHVALLTEHFGGQGDEPLAVQRVELTSGRAAILVSELDDEDGILLVVDGDRLIWSAALPTTGEAAPLAPLALVPGSGGSVAVFGYAAPTKALWARQWSADGTPAPPMRVASVDGCTALSALYSPGLDWIATCASASATRAQLVHEGGQLGWGEGGVDVGATNAVGPATLALASPTSWMLIQRQRKDDLDHLVAFRYDLHAKPAWSAPVDIGVPRRGPAAERLEAATLPNGVVRVQIPHGLRGSHTTAVDIGRDGAVQQEPQTGH